MSSTGLQPNQFPDCFVGLPLSACLEVLAQEDQGDDQGCGVIEGDRANNLWKESRYHAQEVGSCRAERDERIHIRAAMAQRLDGSTVKLPTHDRPDRGGECQK